MTTPLVRLSPSGPPIDLAKIVAGGMGPFALRYRRSGANRIYAAPGTTISDPYAAVLAPTPAPIATEEQSLISSMAYAEIAEIDLDAAYQWALRAHFTLQTVTRSIGAATDLRLGAQIQYFDKDGAWQPLAIGGSGAAIVEISDNTTKGIAIHAVANLSDLDVVPESGVLPTAFPIRVAWGKLGGEEGTTITSISNVGDQEAVTGGWDFSAQWQLRRLAP